MKINCAQNRFAIISLVFLKLIASINYVECGIDDDGDSVLADRNTEYVTVRIDSGIVRGEKLAAIKVNANNEAAENNRDSNETFLYYAFRGIPYAAPPIANLRFKPPVAPQPWHDNVLDALAIGDECPQYDNYFKMFKGSEDCLYVNVYTPELQRTPAERLPVLVFIHGGGYYEGSSTDQFYNADFLIQKNVILVTFNYRLGVFGFMTLGKDSGYTGNMGLKDQRFALDWTRRNIEQFGGDAARVTLCGHSAGASSVHLQTLFQKPKPHILFQRAIVQSGSALNLWAYDYAERGDHRHFVRTAVRKLRPNSDQPLETTVEIMTALNDILPEELIQAIPIMYPAAANRRESLLVFMPVLEDPLAEDAFVIEDPENRVKRPLNVPVDIIFGFTNAEYIMFSADVIKNPDLLKPLDEDFELELPSRSLKPDYKSEKYREMVDSVREYYFGEDGEINNDTVTEYIELMSDVSFVYHIDLAARAHAATLTGTANVFYYRFSGDANLNFFKNNVANVRTTAGASHADELCYLFRCHLIEEIYEKLNRTSIEHKLIDEMTTLWTDFVKTGNPFGEWLPIRGGQLNFLEISNEGLVPALGPNRKAMAFWNKLFRTYGHDELNRAISPASETTKAKR